VYASRFNPQSPKRIDKSLQALVEYLGLDAKSAVHLKYSRPEGFEPAYDCCHFNVWCQLRQLGGKPQPGWILAQDKQKAFSEAIFHAVWSSPYGRLFDVTPRRDNEKRLLFVPDNTRAIVLTAHEGQPAIHTYDNVRLLNDSLVTPLTEITVVMQGDFPQRHGLWPW
jgi:hypothetical protein